MTPGSGMTITRARHRGPRMVRGASIAAVVFLAACVVEKKPATTGAADGVPTGPVARPAGQTTSFRIRVEVMPLGGVPYDGATLPQLSPSGRFAAVQSGEAPSWPTLMAEPDAQAPSAAMISVYDLTTRPLARVQWPDRGEEAVGVVLGRCADDAGFLVEAPRPDGDRWIGRVAWLSGRLEWLVRDAGVNSHAILTRTGDLLYTRRAADAPRADLVLRRADGGEAVLADPSGSYAYPMTAGDPDRIFALVRTPGRLEVESIPLVHDPPGSGPLRFGSARVRRSLAATADPAMAFQVAAPVHAALPLRSDVDEPARAPLVLYHPALKRMAAFDPATAGLQGLAPRSIAAVHWPGPPEGFFCATPDGLVFTRDPRIGDDAASHRPDARVLADPYVARPTTDPARPIILLGPSVRDPERIQLFAMAIPTGAAAP